ncbi:MAG: methyl-accepting chemotaxis protein [Nitrospirota bacterium]
MKHERIIGRSYFPGLIITALGIFVFVIVISALLLYLDIYRPLDTHYSAVLSIITDVRETLVFKTLKITGISSLLIILGLMALLILYTHRIAGPLYRIKVSARSIGEGLLGTKVKFRRKDVIHPFAESINDMTDSYGNKVMALSSEISQLKSSVEEFKAMTRDGKDTEAALKKVLDRDAQIKRIFDTIKL